MSTDKGYMIRQVRELFQLDIEEAAGLARINPDDLVCYESGAHIPGIALWNLSDVLGVPFEDLKVDTDLEPYLLAFQGPLRIVPHELRVAIPRAANAARDFMALKSVAGGSWRLDDHQARVVAPSELRALVLWQFLGSIGSIAGYTFNDPIHGSVVVLNTSKYSVPHLRMEMVPVERRFDVAELAFFLWRKKQITFSRLRQVLRVGLDQVLELTDRYAHRPV